MYISHIYIHTHVCAFVYNLIMGGFVSVCPWAATCALARIPLVRVCIVRVYMYLRECLSLCLGQKCPQVRWWVHRCAGWYAGACLPACLPACTHACVRACVRACMHACMCACVCACARGRVQLDVRCACVPVCTCVPACLLACADEAAHPLCIHGSESSELRSDAMLEQGAGEEASSGGGGCCAEERRRS